MIHTIQFKTGLDLGIYETSAWSTIESLPNNRTPGNEKPPGDLVGLIVAIDCFRLS